MQPTPFCNSKQRRKCICGWIATATPHSTIAIYSLVRFRRLNRVGQMNAPTLAERDKCVSLSFFFLLFFCFHCVSLKHLKCIGCTQPNTEHTHMWSRCILFLKYDRLKQSPHKCCQWQRRINAERRASRQCNFIVKLQTIEMRRLCLICTLKCIQFSPLQRERVCVWSSFALCVDFALWLCSRPKPCCNVRQYRILYI